MILPVASFVITAMGISAAQLERSKPFFKVCDGVLEKTQDGWQLSSEDEACERSTSLSASIKDIDKAGYWRISKVCSAGERCRITGYMVNESHGSYTWSKIISVDISEVLPSGFLGNWESYNSDDPEAQSPNKCSDREGVTITTKNITWNTEGGCNIDNVRLSRWGQVAHSDQIAVSLTCLQEEGRQRPLAVKSVEIWFRFKIEGRTYMSQTSIKNAYTSIFRKCE
jgi:hypothetical protein